MGIHHVSNKRPKRPLNGVVNRGGVYCVKSILKVFKRRGGYPMHYGMRLLGRKNTYLNIDYSFSNSFSNSSKC